jgi:hypothetical protein
MPWQPRGGSQRHRKLGVDHAHHPPFANGPGRVGAMGIGFPNHGLLLSWGDSLAGPVGRTAPARSLFKEERCATQRQPKSSQYIRRTSTTVLVSQFRASKR